MSYNINKKYRYSVSVEHFNNDNEWIDTECVKFFFEYDKAREYFNNLKEELNASRSENKHIEFMKISFDIDGDVLNGGIIERYKI